MIPFYYGSGKTKSNGSFGSASASGSATMRLRGNRIFEVIIRAYLMPPFSCHTISGVEPDSLNLDPDPAFQVNPNPDTDPDPAFQVNPDPDPGF